MKQLFMIASAFLLLGSCNQPSSTATETRDKTVSSNTTSAPSSQNISIPYTPTYATDFEFGDYKYAQTVLNLWKKYDDNDFTADESIFADTVSMDFPNGGSISGRDSLDNSVKRHRASLTSVNENVVTYVVLHSKSKDETWVSIWGNEISTHKDGKTDTVWQNENWKFNKDGKIAYISQYAAASSYKQ